MSVMMVMDWPGIGVEDYEAARRRVNWEGDVPPGAMFHVTAVTEDGMRVVDVWETAEQFQAFVNDRLMPAVQELGIPGEPRMDVLPTHSLFAPAFQPA